MGSVCDLQIDAGDLLWVNNTDAAIRRKQDQQIRFRRKEKVIRGHYLEGAPTREVKGKRLEGRHVPQRFDFFNLHGSFVTWQRFEFNLRPPR